jgi:hypothetical protein
MEVITMNKLLAIPLLAGISIAALPVAANAQSIRFESSSRVCRDSDGDRIPCGRRYVRDRDDDRYYSQRYRRNRDGVSIGVGPRGVYIDND